MTNLRRMYLRWLLGVTAEPKKFRVRSYIIGVAFVVLAPILFRCLYASWLQDYPRLFLMISLAVGVSLTLGVVSLCQALFVVETFRFFDREKLRRELESRNDPEKRNVS